jgi:hypothetical protein
MPVLKEYNDFGQLVCTIPGVLAPVTLSGVSTTSGSSTITCASTTGVYPGMSIRCAGFANPCIVHAVQNSTTLQLVASAFSASGVWTTSAANAQASATASSLTATALGFDPQAIVASTYAMGVWRNLHSRTTALGYYQIGAGTPVVGVGPGAGITYVPGTVTVTGGIVKADTATVQTSDDLAATPLKRHNGEFWSYYLVVSTHGHLSKIPAIPSNRVIYSE